MRLLLILLLYPFSTALQAQSAKDTIRWQSLEEISKLMPENPRPVLMDVYTDWCHYCHLMDATTYHTDSVTQFINQHYYRVRVNAEDTGKLVWGGKTYFYKPQLKLHDLVIVYTRGNIVYPSTILLNPAGNFQSYGGYLTSSQLMPLLKEGLK